MSVKVKAGKTYRSRDGQKVGPLNDFGTAGSLNTMVAGVDRVFDAENGKHAFGKRELDLVAEWGVGPVRERTVKEIVHGKYGRLGTLEIAPNGVNAHSAAVSLENRFYTQADLREIASLITAIADALDEAA